MSAIMLITKLLDLFIAGALTLERAKAIRAKVQQFKDEGRDPTDEEMLEVFDTIDRDRDRINAANERLNPDED